MENQFETPQSFESQQQSSSDNSIVEPISYYEQTKRQAGANKRSKGNSVLWKGVLIVLLCLVLLVPQFLISNLINERSNRQAQVIEEISSKWAKDQTVAGPILSIPYLNSSILPSGKSSVHKEYIYIMPTELVVNGELFPEVRRRTIFDVTVYNSILDIKGYFNNTKIDFLRLNDANILWNEARLCFGISDKKGLQEKLKINWNGTQQEMFADNTGIEFLDNAFYIPIALTKESLLSKYSFSLSLNLKGAQSLGFVPVGGSSVVNIKSSSPKPSFGGKYLAAFKMGDSAYKKGFEATWKVLDINRSFPQVWRESANAEINNTQLFANETFHVKIMNGLDAYAKTQRAIKYAMLVVFLTFLIYFFTELFENKYVHPIQYTLVGLALCIFYTLLLSIGEYIGFKSAYFIALVSTLGLIAMYTQSIFKIWKTTCLFTGFLSTIYIFVFILIQLEDSALLVGSIGLFIILAVIMYLSQRIKWTTLNEQQQ